MKKCILGQLLDPAYVEAVKNLDPNAPWHEKLLVKYRRYVGIFIPWATLVFDFCKQTCIKQSYCVPVEAFDYVFTFC